MKKLIAIAFLTIISYSSYSQSNLQFSRVLTYTGYCSKYDGVGNRVIDTVPVGVVWKIMATGLSPNNGVTLYINGNGYNNCSAAGTGNGGGISWTISEQIWLKSGDIISYNYPNGEASYVLSIIEYKISP